jgi:Zn-dependent M28 family amino/carboxypeptidase
MWLQQMGTRFALAGNHRDVAMKIRQKYIDIGYADCRLDSFMIELTYRGTSYDEWQYNVVATLQGSKNPDTYYIIGGHYDDILSAGDPFTTVPGADDNAGGVAAAIELARVMKKNDYHPSGTIEFIAFAAEELGLWGSYNYAYNASFSSKDIKFVLNNDMILYEPQPEAAWSVNILDYDNSHELRKRAEDMTAKFTSLSYHNDNTHNRQSDSYPFFQNGFDAIFFYSDAGDPNYHSIEDTYDKQNFEYCREIAKICCAMIVYNN